MIRLDVDEKAVVMAVLINTYKAKYGYIYDSYRLREPRILKHILDETGIAINEGSYQCGCWGKKHDPRIDENSYQGVVIETGVGYKSNKHFHAQNYSILGFTKRSVLIELRKSGDFSSKHRYLFILHNGKVHIVRHLPKNADVWRCEQIALRRLQKIATEQIQNT
jgi:hypothetical protein